ncbi:MAG: primosomal protein N' [Cyclobacteriaceae bacterium]|nr:primosomal protein N' [Cyclobacteriaceae bacterium]
MAKSIPNLFETPTRTTYFVQVILPVPVPKYFTYRVPFELNNIITEGQRVVVPFGQRNVLTGLVKSIGETPPANYEAKLIIDVLEDTPAFNARMLRFINWLGSYYMANPGDVLNVALPAGLKISSESLVQLNPAFIVPKNLATDEILLIDYLTEHEYIPYQEIQHLVGKKSINKLIKALLAKEAIILFDKIKERFSPKKTKFIRLNPMHLTTGDNLQQVFETLEKKPKQQNILVSYLKILPVLENPSLNNKGIKRLQLVEEGCSLSSIKTLEKNNVFETFEVIESRFDEHLETEASLPLSKAQEQALSEIFTAFEQKSTVYLHGITSSGKTEIYIELIKQVLANDEQVLFLVPEIALTTQLVIRLKKILGSKVGVYHSRFSDNERVEVWQGVQTGKYNFVIGVRSSLFLPFDNLGLIIIDEEHEPSYKQMDPSPRYHARDSALVLAVIHHAKVLMGSGTPSIESYYHAQQGKYGLVLLTKRYGDSILPEIITANIAREQKKKTMKGYISSQLFNAMEQTLAANKQIIIFQNRRGYAPFLSCTVCGWTPHCHHCDVSLTYHLYNNELKCHYCGHTDPVPSICNECSSADIKTNNYGTEQLEESLQLLFPHKKVARMDQDTTKGKYSFDKLISEFSKQEIDILVGTQMVAKGLDFAHVQLVGIFDIDRMIHFPDFRSAERTYNLATQVAGRAGRRKEQGQVIIQSMNPNQDLINFIIRQDYNAFYKTEIEERELFKYPPFVRIIKLTIRHRNEQITAKAAEMLVEQLHKNIANQMIYGPIEPVISKLRNKYLQEVIIKIKRVEKNLNQVKVNIWKSTQQVIFSKHLKGVQIIFNIDPM